MRGHIVLVQLNNCVVASMKVAECHANPRCEQKHWQALFDDTALFTWAIIWIILFFKDLAEKIISRPVNIYPPSMLPTLIFPILQRAMIIFLKYV